MPDRQKEMQDKQKQFTKNIWKTCKVRSWKEKSRRWKKKRLFEAAEDDKKRAFKASEAGKKEIVN